LEVAKKSLLVALELIKNLKEYNEEILKNTFVEKIKEL